MQNKLIIETQKERLHTSLGSVETQKLPFSPTVSSINQWLQELPVLNVNIIGKNLYIASSAILTNKLEAGTKLSLIEEIIPNLYIFFDGCVKEILDAKFPLHNKLNSLTETLLLVLETFFDVYIDVIKSDSYSSEELTKDRALIIHRTLSIQGLMQLFSSITYRPTAIDNWGEINALLCLAQHDGLENIETGIHTENKYNSTNITSEFVKINYAHLALLNRFRQRDILKIHELINSQAPSISITKDKPKHASFFINPYKNVEINNINALQNQEEGILFFENELLIQYFTSLALDKTANKMLLNSTVIQKLLPCWQKPHNRQFARTNITKDIVIYPGFKNIIDRLFPKDTPSVSLGHKPIPRKQNTFGLSNVEIIPIENETFRHNNHKNSFLRSEKDIGRVIKASKHKTVKANDIWNKKQKAEQSTGNAQHLAAIQKDTSAAGFMFQVSQENKSLLQAADLIAIETVNEKKLELAIIRRLDNLKDQGLSLGVELIAPNIKLGIICNADKSIRSREVLFLPGVEKLKQADTIICISPIENTRINLELKIEKQLNTYIISKLVETNTVFTRYTLQKIIKEG